MNLERTNRLKHLRLLRKITNSMLDSLRDEPMANDPIVSSWIDYHRRQLEQLQPKYEQTRKDIAVLQTIDTGKLDVSVYIYVINDRNDDGDTLIYQTKAVDTIQNTVNKAVKEFKSQFPHEYIEDFAVKVSCKMDNGTKLGLIMKLTREQVQELITNAQKTI